MVTTLKLAILLALLGYVGWKLREAWSTVSHDPIRIDWFFAGLSVVFFAGTMLTSALTWRWLAWRMGDRSETVPLLGAYCFSQMGKYVPGKVMLLLMRLERTKRMGMDGQVCVVATLVENAMYMVSGGLVAAVTLVIFLRGRPMLMVGVIGGMVVLLLAFHPKIFYWAVNKGLKKMKRAEVAEGNRLGIGQLLAAVAMFMPVWFFGGVSLWCATRAITPGIEWREFASIPGGYALGVTGGMASFLPGGIGANEGVKTLMLEPVVGVKIAALAAGVQRLAQIIVELALGLIGGVITRCAFRQRHCGRD